MEKLNHIKEWFGNIFGKCGIEIENFEKAVQIIKEQIKDMRNGKFTQEELEQMAAIMGCKYQSSFVFPDGNEIK